MSDEVQQPDESWPTHCPQCGTALQSVMVDFLPGDVEDEQSAVPGQPVFSDLCPNPECPAHVAAREAADPEQVARVEEAVSHRDRLDEV